MPEHHPPDEEPEIRPEIVQAVFSALIDTDPGRLAPLEAEVAVRPAERAQAEDLYAASLRASHYQRRRWLDAMKVLTTGRDLSGGGSWADLFDGLSPEQVSQLRELYGRHARWRPGRIRPQIRAARRDLIRTPGGKRFPMSLIFATQLTAVATAVLAVFAIVTVIFAILAYCTQKREVEHLFKESDRRAVDRRRAQAAGCSPAYHPIRPA